MSSSKPRHNRRLNVRLPRRAVLRGAAYGGLSALALPVLDIMLNDNGTALAQSNEALPKRFGVYFWGNGVRLAQWTPDTQGAGFELTEELAPLMPVRDYISIVSGMSIKSGNERGHHAGTVGILSGAPMISQDPMGAPYASTFSQPSIDQLVATQLGDVTRFRSLELGVSRAIVGGEGSTLRYLSHNGPDNTNPPEYSPRAAFERVFGTGFTDPGSEPLIDPRLALRRSVIDAVRDAAELRTPCMKSASVSPALVPIRALENQSWRSRAAPPPSGCVAPTTLATSRATTSAHQHGDC